MAITKRANKAHVDRILGVRRIGAKVLGTGKGVAGRPARIKYALAADGTVIRFDKVTGQVFDTPGRTIGRYVVKRPTLGQSTVQVHDDRLGTVETYTLLEKRQRFEQKRPSRAVALPAVANTTTKAERIAAELVRKLTAKDPTGTLLASVDPEDFADRVVDQVDTAPLWSAHLGPVYSAKSVAAVLGVSKQAVQQNKGLLRMTTEDGTVVYPAYQFEGTRQARGVSPIVQAARGEISDWTLASWFVTENDDLAGKRPIDAIGEGKPEDAFEAARAWLSGLAG